MAKPVYLSAREAAAELGVQPATLYAYVSRGLIRSVAGPGKQRRYDAFDVRMLQARKDSGETAGGHSGGPDGLLESSLTLITDDGPFYRGRSAMELAQSSTLEAVATLLWDCDLDPFAAPVPGTEIIFPDDLDPLSRLAVALAEWPLRDKAASTLSEPLLLVKGGALVRYGVAALLRGPLDDGLIHQRIIRAWGCHVAGAEEVVRAALVLGADHELNTGAYVVRCCASTRAPLHACLMAGLSAFSGPRHGAATDRVSAWLDLISMPDDVEPVLSGRLSRGEKLPGFGHPIYSGKDPRAECLLTMLKGLPLEGPFREGISLITDMAEQLFGLHPNIDFALAVLQRALGFPVGSAKVLLCAGRMVGWVAHALEQYRVLDQIRARATYVGERPR